jgi:hypothetical protein
MFCVFSKQWYVKNEQKLQLIGLSENDKTKLWIKFIDILNSEMYN